MNELTTKTKTVSMMEAQKMYIDTISSGLESIIGTADSYQILCGYNMLNAINALLAREGLNHLSKEKVDQGTINNAIKFAMVYSLNTDNREVFVIARNLKVTVDKTKNLYKWIKVIECKPQYRGQLKIISTFGRDVAKVYPEWIVREGDEFTYPTMKGVESIPPTWVRKGGEGKVLRVVVPIKYKDGFIDYRIAERESVATNIKAQIKQSLMADEDKEESKRILALIKDMSLDDLLSNSSVASYVNETYKGISAEEMLITKLVINATKRVAIEYGSALRRELLEKTYDNADVYTPSHQASELVANETKQIEVQADENGVVEEKKQDEVVEEVLPQTENDLAALLGE